MEDTVKTQQMIGRLLIVNTENEVVALPTFVGKKNFYRIVDIPAFGKKLQLGLTGTPEKFQFICGGRYGHIAVTFLLQKLFDHFIRVSQL